MKIRIKETQELKELVIRDIKGKDRTYEMLVDEARYNPEKQEFEIDKKDYVWWSDYIKKREEKEKEIIKGEEDKRTERLLIIGIIIIAMIGFVVTAVFGVQKDLMTLFAIFINVIVVLFGVKFIRKIVWVDKKIYRR